jgi:ribonuclease HI
MISSWGNSLDTARRTPLAPVQGHSDLGIAASPETDAPPEPNYRYDPNGYYYTDGSRLETGETGAAYYHPNYGIEARIDPSGRGPTNTINRAELAGILGALSHACRAGTRSGNSVHVLTDSRVSIYQIHKFNRNKQSFVTHKHIRLLGAIDSLIDVLQSRGIKVTIGKVKAHTGIEGNEVADQLAGQAAGGQFEETITIGNDIIRQWWWLGQPRGDGDYAPGQTSQPPNDLDPGGLRYLESIPRWVSLQLRLEPSRGIYADSWDRTAETVIDANHDVGRILPRLTVSVMATRAKYNWGAIYTNKLALRYGHAGAMGGRCPMPGCDRMDSVGHMVGECTHPALVGCRIAAHNKVVGHVLKAYLKGDWGNYLVFADAGKEAEALADGHTSDLPRWLVGDAITRYSKPDLVILKGCRRLPQPHPAAERHLTAVDSVHIVEIGLIRDTQYAQAWSTKSVQHTRPADPVDAGRPPGLATVLRDRGYAATVHTMLFGRGGTVYKGTGDSLRQIGVPKHALDSVLQKIQTTAVTTLHGIVITRRTHETRRDWRPP